MKQAALILLAAVLALGGGIVAKRYLSSIENTAQAPLPDFSLPDLSGKQHRISEWQGKIRVINFWATWCPPCLKEIPEFIAMQQEYSAKSLQFIGIAIDDKKAVEDYLNTTKINYPLLMGADEGIALSRQLGNKFDAVPFTLVVDKQGTIIYRQPGELSREKILTIIASLIH
ncbi:MAG: TlpA family protein disulfide reductase [Methylobacter sp.]